MSIMDSLRGFVNNRFFMNEHLQDFVWKFYYAPDKRCPSVPISAQAQTMLSELQEKGLVILPARLPELADYVDNEYFEVLERRKPRSSTQYLEEVATGKRGELTETVAGKLSFKDSVMAPLFFDADLCGLIYNYYQRQPYYRNQPFLSVSRIKDDSKLSAEIQTKFHIDLYRQISFMLLVNDLTDKDTCLQYAIGSHQDRNKPWDRYSYADEDICARYKIVNGVGPKGTLLIFDAGCGYHRGNYKRNSTRKFVHTNITTGHYLSMDKKIDSVVGWRELNEYPDHVKRMVDKVALR